MKFTDEQKRTFAEATGMEPEKVTDEILEAAGVKPADEPEGEGERSLEAGERIRTLEQKVETEAEGRRKLEAELHEERKRNFVEGLLSDGRILPGDREKWEKRYDANPDAARDYAADLKPNDELAREYGAEHGEPDEETRQAEERAYEADAAARLDIPKEALI